MQVVGITLASVVAFESHFENTVKTRVDLFKDSVYIYLLT